MKKAGTFLLAICMSMVLVLAGCGDPDGTSPEPGIEDNGGGMGDPGGGMDGGTDGGLDGGTDGGMDEAPAPGIE